MLLLSQSVSFYRLAHHREINQALGELESLERRLQELSLRPDQTEAPFQRLRILRQLLTKVNTRKRLGAPPMDGLQQALEAAIALRQVVEDQTFLAASHQQLNSLILLGLRQVELYIQLAYQYLKLGQVVHSVEI